MYNTIVAWTVPRLLPLASKNSTEPEVRVSDVSTSGVVQEVGVPAEPSGTVVVGNAVRP